MVTTIITVPPAGRDLFEKITARHPDEISIIEGSPEGVKARVSIDLIRVSASGWHWRRKVLKEVRG